MRDGWVARSLSEVVEHSIGGVWGGESGTDEVEVTVVRSTEFTKRGFLNFETGVPRSIKLSQLKSRELKPGDILLEKSGGGPDQPVGRVVFVTDTIPEKFVCSNFVQLVRPNSEQIEPLLLFHIMWQWHAINRTLEFQAQTTGIRNLRTPDYLEQEISLPPLSEQKRIVDLISAVDSYIESLQQQLESVRSASNAQLEKIVSEFNDDWVEVTLGEVLEISRGGSPRPIQDYLTDFEEGINWVKIADATRSEKYIYSTLQKIKREGISRSREVFSGDFILSNSMSFGRPYIMRTDGCIHDGWLLLSNVSKYFDEDFLYNLLNSDYVQRQFESLAAGSGVRNLNIEVVKKVKVKIPTIEVQKELASVINEFDNFKISLTKQIHSVFNLRSALLSDLLSGEHEIPASYDKVMGAA